MAEKTGDEMAKDDMRLYGTGFVRHYADGRRERIDPREVFIFSAADSRWLAKVWVWSALLTAAAFAIFIFFFLR